MSSSRFCRERIIHLCIPGYQEHQKNLKNRRYLAMDTDFFSNHKVREAKRNCLDSIYCYQWLWANVDYETESLSIKESSLKLEWMDVCASQSNRFDLQKRLNALSNAGLIKVQYESNDVLTESQHHSNDVLMQVQYDPNASLTESESPLEPAENRMVLRATITNQLTEETTTNQLSAPGRGLAAGCFFEISLRGQEMREDEWIFRCFLEGRRSKKLSVEGCHDLSSLLGLYPSHFDRYRRWVTQPTARRMAAFAYTALHSNADDPFKYALKALEEGETWDRMPGYIRKAEEDVKQNDLRVVIK